MFTFHQLFVYNLTFFLLLQSDDVSDCDLGFDTSLQLIRKTLEEQGPFDGLMGFSQGAAFAAILALMDDLKNQPQPPFKFCMLFAPFMSCCSKHRSYFDEKTTSKAKIPSLFVVGNGDQVVDPRRSEALLAFFERPHLIHHDGGHYVPATGKQKQSYLEFLQARLSEKISA